MPEVVQAHGVKAITRGRLITEKVAMEHTEKNWTFEEIVRLISICEDYPCLHNVNSPIYKDLQSFDFNSSIYSL